MSNSGVVKYHCGYRQSGLDVGFCPLDIRGERDIDGKQVVIGWYVQKKIFWAFSQRQVFEVRQGETEILTFDRAVKYYQSQGDKGFCALLLIFLILIYLIFLRRIYIGNQVFIRAMKLDW